MYSYSNTVHIYVALKTVENFGNCQIPVFSLCIISTMHKITNLWKFELNWSSKLQNNYAKKKHPCHTNVPYWLNDFKFNSNSLILEVCNLQSGGMLRSSTGLELCVGLSPGHDTCFLIDILYIPFGVTPVFLVHLQVPLFIQVFS